MFSGIRRKVRQVLTGESSALRRVASNWDFQYSKSYTLDSSRVDYELARTLYRNTDSKYKLGAAFARPVINTIAGFMGVPSFAHPDPEAQMALEQYMEKWKGCILRINRNALRDGDVFVRCVHRADRFDGIKRLSLVLVPPEWVTPHPNPITGTWDKVVISHPIKTLDETGRPIEYKATETITPDEITITVDDHRAPQEIKDQLEQTSSNPWGFIPIVHFRNEAEEHQVWGASEIEPLEPFMKAYHDTLYSAVQGSRLFSRPKARFALKDVEKFLKDNFAPDEIESGKLKFADKELFLLQDGDDVSFITADSGLAGTTTLLEFIFMNIVDVSETPEFAFGTAIASSKASVSEQMVPLDRKINRKRGQFEEHYSELAAMVLAMWSFIENRRLESLDVDISWGDVSPRDEKALADTIKSLVEGLLAAVDGGVLSVDAASEFLRAHITTMLPFVDPDADMDEMRRIEASMLWRKRLEDPEGWTEDPDAEEDPDPNADDDLG